jgi:hypothetical protein
VYCPECRAEFREGFTECSDCHVPLIQQQQSTWPAEEPTLALVNVFESSDPVLIALARSTLESSGIEFVTKGEPLQDLIGYGRFPGGVNLVTGPVVFEVRAAAAEQASTLLADVLSAEPETGEQGNDRDDVG